MMLLRSIFIIVHNSWTLTSGPFSAVFLFVVSHLIFIYSVRLPLLPSLSTLLATYICFICFILCYFWLHWSSLLHAGFSSCREQRLLFAAVHGLLIVVVTSLLRSMGSGARVSTGAGNRLSCCMACGILLDQEIKPVSLALAGGFQPLDHQGTPHLFYSCWLLIYYYSGSFPLLTDFLLVLIICF